MKTSDSINELAAALSLVQGEIRPATKSRTVKVATKAGGEYSFDYATLDDVWETIREPLAKHNLAILQDAKRVEEDVIVTTRLLHASGQFVESELAHKAPHEIQTLGSIITYLRRYALSPLLGITSEEDDDGNTAAGNEIQTSVSRGNKSLPPCPECGKTDSVIVGKAEYGGGFVCFAKKGGCGFKWQAAEEGPATTPANGKAKPRPASELGTPQQRSLYKAGLNVILTAPNSDELEKLVEKVDQHAANGTLLDEHIAKMREAINSQKNMFARKDEAMATIPH